MKTPIQWAASHDNANHSGVCGGLFYRVHVRDGQATAIYVDPLAHPPYQPLGVADAIDAAKALCEQYDEILRARAAANDSSSEGAE